MYSFYNPSTHPDKPGVDAQLIQQKNPILAVNNFFPNDFYMHATSDQSVLISTCANLESGCHDFARSLKGEFNDTLEHVKLSEVEHPYPSATFVPSLKKSNYRYVFVTGCQLYNSKVIVNNYLRHRFHIAIERVYIIIPPHLQTTIDSNYILQSCQFRAIGSSYNVQIFNTGIDSSIPANLGCPSSISALETSEYKLPERCYGLIYVNQCDLKSNIDIAQEYLYSYFSQIVKVARLKGVSSCSVFLIGNGMTISTKDNIQEIANNANNDGITITVILSNRLKQNHFIDCLRQISDRNGIIATDGVQTLRQVLNFKGGFMILNTDNNASNAAYYLSLVKALSEDLRNIGEVILGQSNNYSLLDGNEEKIQKIFLELHLLEIKSVEKFKMGIQTAHLLKLNGFLGDRNQQRDINNIDAVTPTNKNKFSCCAIS